MTHADLVFLAHRWLASRGHTAFTEKATYNNETPDAIGWKSGMSMLVECKASRDDFKKDNGKRQRRYPEMGLGRLRYYLCPWGLIQSHEVPECWGLLWARGGRVYVRKKAEPFPEYDLRGELRFLNGMVRRADVRLGDVRINDWVRWENRRGDVDI